MQTSSLRGTVWEGHPPVNQLTPQPFSEGAAR